MSRIPKVEREGVLGGLTTQSASEWYRFMADEVYFAGDALKSSEYISRAEALERSPTGSIHSKELEQEIKKWESKRSDESS